MIFDSKLTNGIHRNKFIDAVKAELPNTLLREDSPVLMGCGYVKPLYLLPIYQEQIAFGKGGYPFNLSTNTNYNRGICPVTEDMHYNKLISHELMRPGMEKKDMDDVVSAFEKVWTNRKEL
ncbi:MAG TPA: hypothetical protein QF753_05935 [Victivallales bacterium]|nr:hypothetical protein [Victivallales bacterium]